MWWELRQCPRMSTERWDGALVQPQRRMLGTQPNQYIKMGLRREGKRGGASWQVHCLWVAGRVAEEEGRREQGGALDSCFCRCVLKLQVSKLVWGGGRTQSGGQSWALAGPGPSGAT